MNKIDKICNWIIKLGLVIFALGMGFSISVMEIGLYIFIFLPWIIKQIIHRQNPFAKNVYTIPVILYLLAVVVSTYFGYDSTASLHGFKHLGKLVILFMLPQVISDINQYKNMFKITLLSVTINALYGIYQFFILKSVERAGGTSFYMTFGGILMILGLVGYALFLESVKEKKVVPTIAIGTALTIILTALVVSFTRNAWIGCLLGLFVITFLNVKLVPKIVLSLLALITVTAVLFYSPQIRHRAKSIIDIRQDGTNQERIMMWKSGIKNLPEYVFTGVGINNVPLFFEKHQVPIATKCHMHNNFLQIVLELGGLGLISFCWLFYLGYFEAVRTILRDKQTAWGSLIIASISAFLIGGLFEYNFGDTEVVTLVLVLLSSIAIRKWDVNK